MLLQATIIKPSGSHTNKGMKNGTFWKDRFHSRLGDEGKDRRISEVCCMARLAYRELQVQGKMLSQR